MILTVTAMKERERGYRQPEHRIRRMVADGRLVQLRRGLYTDDASVSPCAAAGLIYGPSYISFEYALSYHGMIPERVYTVTCATFRKNRKKEFYTPIGNFTYRDVPAAVYRFGVRREALRTDEACLMAEPVKALCDKLYTVPAMAAQRQIEAFLFEDMRMDAESLRQISVENVTFLAERYPSANVKQFAAWFRRWSRKYA